MSLPSQPVRAIFPIFKASAIPKKQYLFLGTAFFINSSGVFLTAKHVLMGSGDDCCAAMINPQDYSISEYRISNIRYSAKFDIALGKVDNVENIQPLTLATENPPINNDIMTLEYSRICIEQDKYGIRRVIIIPAFRKGHVVCFYISSYPESIPTSCLELSFPALKGASGAPVVVEVSGVVVGMIVENVQHELLPSHIERVTDGAKHVEEIKYVLPSAKAISWKHLNDFAKEQPVYNLV